MASLQKPDFEAGSGGWLDADFFPVTVRLQLKDLMMEADHSTVDGDRFISSCARLAQLVTAGKEEISLDTERAQLTAMANAARRLLAAINSTSQQTRATFEVQTDALTHQNSSIGLARAITSTMAKDGPEELLLSRVWDHVHGLQLIAEYAALELKPSRQSKPGDVNARRLARLIVGAYLTQFGQLPPSNQAGWFAGFMASLGDHVHVICGPRIVRDAIDSRKTQIR